MTLLRFCFWTAVLCSITVFCEGFEATEKAQGIPNPVLPKSLKSSSSASETSVEPLKPSSPESISDSSPVPISLSTTTPTTSATSTTSAPPSSPSSTIKPIPTSKPTSASTPASTPASSPTPIPPTTPASAPTPAPGPLPPPQQGTWAYTDKKNLTCILIKFAAQLNVTYPIDNSSTPLGHLVLNVPPGAEVVNGSCNGTQQWLEIDWPLRNETASPSNRMVMVFAANATTKLYALERLDLTLAPELFPNASAELRVQWRGAAWRTAQATSYRCSPPTQLNLTAEAANQVATLTLSQLQEEAFRTVVNSTAFSAPHECGGGDVPDAVPIAVGCALGGLVLVVLVAYLVGRRRSAARGYLSM